MNLAHRVTLTLVLTASAWQVLAASDYFWNCTIPEGIKYADATQCDKGDSAVKVMKSSAADPIATPTVQAAAQPISKEDRLVTGVCPANRDYCAQPNYGVSDGSPRSQATPYSCAGESVSSSGVSQSAVPNKISQKRC
jgi:hypothetical protein